jgi:uncharacterized membrane protein (Fun14 family)
MYTHEQEGSNSVGDSTDRNNKYNIKRMGLVWRVRLGMVVDGSLTTGLVPFAGSGLCGFIMGYAVKKIIKWALIILGVLGGIVFLVIQWMSSNGYIQGIKWDKLGNDIASYGQQLAAQIDFTNLHGIFHYLGVPVTSGLAVGMVAGFLKAL